jgi:hypothetical protein
MGLARMFRPVQLCKAALEAAGIPLNTRELATVVAEAKGLDGQDRVLRKALALSIVNVMTRQAKRGVVVTTGTRCGVRIWSRLSECQSACEQSFRII